MKKQVSKKQVFVAGCARSGTTAFTRLLNSHPDIVVLTENFGQQFHQSDSTFNNELLEEKNILLTNPKLENKLKHASYIGDKLPSYYLNYGKLFGAFPDAICLFLIRNIFDVAQSYKVRKEMDSKLDKAKDYKLNHNNKKKKIWTKGVRMAVQDWNLALENTLAAMEQNLNVKPLIYEKVFSGKQDFLVQLLALSKHNSYDEFYKKSINIANKLNENRDSILTNRDKLWIMNNAKFDLYKKILSL